MQCREYKLSPIDKEKLKERIRQLESEVDLLDDEELIQEEARVSKRINKLLQPKKSPFAFKNPLTAASVLGLAAILALTIYLPTDERPDQLMSKGSATSESQATATCEFQLRTKGEFGYLLASCDQGFDLSIHQNGKNVMSRVPGPSRKADYVRHLNGEIFSFDRGLIGEQILIKGFQDGKKVFEKTVKYSGE